MGLIFSLFAVAALIVIGILGAGAPLLFGVILPYAAIAIFVIGLVVRIVRWARSPVPFRITTTCGQEKSLDFIRQNKFDNPYTGIQVFIRMALEILLFRSLFRNTKAELREGPKLVYGANKWLWLFSLAFHWSFLVIVLRHFRFFTEPAPFFIPIIQQLDGFFQISVPIIYITNVTILVGLGYLLFRRLLDSKLRYISIASDWFPLLLIIAIAVTGILMRYFIKVELMPVKELAVSLLYLKPTVPAGINPLFYLHLFLVCTLLVYFPMSKLVHMSGIFMSPTRNMANNNRARRHVNPWNPDLHVHSYEEYEDEFRKVMIEAGIPVDKEGKDVN